MPVAGFQRSRALWDNCRACHHGSPTVRSTYQRTASQVVSTNSTNTTNTIRHYARALLYEIQPIRYSVFTSSCIHGYRSCVQNFSTLLVECQLLLPHIFRFCHHTIKEITMRQYMYIFGGFVYYLFVRWVHNAFDAGPIVVIVTALCIIFTVGLSDNASTDGLSAYSVFNKGFLKILGSVDADSLLQQHVGGGIMMPMVMRQQPIDIDDDHELNRHRLHQRRRQQQYPQLNNNPPDEADDINQNDTDNNNENRHAEQAPPQARKSGKKARRQGRISVEQRREIRAQQVAALALGLHYENDDDALAQLQ